MLPITLKDVARAAGIHYSTASRALDPNKRSLVNAATAAHVQAIADRLGYRQHMVARSLRRGQTNTIGVVLPDLDNQSSAPLLHGVTGVLEGSGYIALVGETQNDHQRYRRLLERLAGWRVDAIITAATRLSDAPFLRQFTDGGVPVLLAIRTLPGRGFVSVSEDGVGGGALVAGHLFELGHRLVAQLQGPPDVQTFKDRARGFAREARRRGVEICDFNETASRSCYEEGHRLMARLLQQASPRLTAVFAHNDHMAVGAIDAVRERGLRCPDDLSVIGYNDAPLVDHVWPALSTVRMPARELGALAGQAVIKLIERQEPPPASTWLTPTLVARASTGPAPAR
jgi:LacI family transcriptional regulator, galactose operon repressor